MQRPLNPHNANILKIGGIKFSIDNGKLVIHAPNERYPFPLSGQQTHALYNLLCDCRLEIIGASVAEQSARIKSVKATRNPSGCRLMGNGLKP